jgi:aspartate aminotransferase
MLLSEIEGSPSLEVVSLVLQKRAKGEDVISLAIGDPESATPSEIVEAAYSAMKAGDVHYVPSFGTPGVRRAISRKVGRKNGITATPEETIFLPTKHAVYASLFAISELGYEALTPDPGYFYSEPILLSGGKPVRYELNDDFSLNVENIKRKTTPKTKAILVNSPSNPTGRVLIRSELRELYDFCADRDIYIISDDAYEDLVFDGLNHFAVGSIERRPDKVISIFSLSKSYAMTGWRAGYTVASKEVVHSINKFLENTMTCFPPFIQKAAEYALENGDSIIESQRKEYSLKRKLLVDKLEDIPGISMNEIQGAFYAFPKLQNWKQSSTHFSKQLLFEENIAVLPGIAFGNLGEGHFRISFSGGTKELEIGLDGIRRFLLKSQ